MMRLEAALDRVVAESLKQARLDRIGRRQHAILSRLAVEAARKGSDVARWYPGPQSISESKATSRALRRLERRGLVVRLREPGPGGLQTTRVRLTVAGARTARLDHKDLRAQARLARVVRRSRKKAA